MKELLLYIARSLVQHPDQVTVTEVETGDELTLELRVAPEDMGRVIGRQGRIAKEIRTLIRSYAQRTGVKASSMKEAAKPTHWRSPFLRTMLSTVAPYSVSMAADSCSMSG